jgi:peptidyl-prolyl cis-trans isomerase C
MMGKQAGAEVDEDARDVVGAGATRSSSDGAGSPAGAARERAEPAGAAPADGAVPEPDAAMDDGAAAGRPIDDDAGSDGAGSEDAGTGEPGTAERADADPAPVDLAADPVDPAAADGAGVRRRLRLPVSGGRLVAAVVVVALLVAASGVFWWRATALPADAAYRLDGRVVTVDELDQRLVALRALYGVEAPDDPAAADGFRRDLARSVVLSDILDREAADRAIVVADKQVTDTRDRYIEEQFGAGGREAYVQALANVGTSDAAVLDEIRRQLTVGRLMEAVVGRIEISDDELRAAYEERQGRLGTPERRTLRNIVVETEQEARLVVDELRAGTPFEQVAAARSRDASTRESGGLLGELGRAELEGPVGEAAFAVAPGELYGPVQGQFGWNVGRVDAVTPFVPAGFDQVAEGLRQALEVERGIAVWRDWIADRLRDADVDYAEEYRPADPDAPPPFGAPAAPAPAAPR